MSWKDSQVMKDIINLNNNYYIKVVNENNEIPFDSISIKNLKVIRILKKERIIFQIDFNKFNTKEYKKILKKLLFVKNIAIKIKKKFGLDEDKKKIVAYIINFNENDVAQKDFISGINAIFYNTRYERYNYIYDTACEYLNKENYTCDAKCLPCKLFTCDYLESKGIKFKIKNILLLDVFLNPLQKYFIKYMVFTPKEKILKRLMML